MTKGRPCLLLGTTHQIYNTDSLAQRQGYVEAIPRWRMWIVIRKQRIRQRRTKTCAGVDSSFIVMNVKKKTDGQLHTLTQLDQRLATNLRDVRDYYMMLIMYAMGRRAQEATDLVWISISQKGRSYSDG